MQSVCCGCLKEIPMTDRTDVFDEDAWIHLDESNESVKTCQYRTRAKLSDAIELIIGRKIDRTNGRSIGFLCIVCLQTIESYVNFRARLLSSLDKSNDKRDSAAVLSNVEESNDKESTKTDGTSDSSVRPTDGLTHLTHHRKTSLTDNNECRIYLEVSKPKIATFDVISAEGNCGASLSRYRNTSVVDDGGDTSDSVSSATVPTNRRQNGESETSDQESDVSSAKEIPSRIRENDIESEIDVCSGEDDEVLELDSQSKRDEIVEIENSSESDIEVCDYEPTGKKIKSYNALSPVLF